MLKKKVLEKLFKVLMAAILAMMLVVPDLAMAADAVTEHGNLSDAYAAAEKAYNEAKAIRDEVQQKYDEAVAAFNEAEAKAADVEGSFRELEGTALEICITELEEALPDLKEAASDAKEAFGAAHAKFKDGAYEFFPWVAENYPQYKEDAEDALATIELAASEDYGYSERHPEGTDQASLYSMKASIGYMKDYYALRDFLGAAHLPLTNLTVIADAMMDVGGGDATGYHYTYWLRARSLSEVLAFGYQMDPEHVNAYNGNLVRYTELPRQTELRPMEVYPFEPGGSEETEGAGGYVSASTGLSYPSLDEWLEMEAESGIFEACRFLYYKKGTTMSPYYGWYTKEKYYYDCENIYGYTGFSDRSTGHYTLLSGRTNARDLVGFSIKGSTFVLDLGTTDSIRNEHDGMSISTYEGLVDAFYESLGLEEKEAAMENAERLFSDAQAEHEYLIAKKTLGEAKNTLNEASAKTSEKEKEWLEARDALAEFEPYEP